MLAMLILWHHWVDFIKRKTSLIRSHNHMVSWNHTWHSYVSFRFFTWNQPVLEINLTWNQPLLKSTCVDMNRKWDWPETFKHFSSFEFWQLSWATKSKHKTVKECSSNIRNRKIWSSRFALLSEEHMQKLSENSKIKNTTWSTNVF